MQLLQGTKQYTDCVQGNLLTELLSVTDDQACNYDHIIAILPESQKILISSLSSSKSQCIPFTGSLSLNSIQ